MPRISTINPSLAVSGNPQRAEIDDLKAQVIGHILPITVTGSKTDLPLRAGSSVAQAVLGFRSGAQNGNWTSDYGNMNLSAGSTDGVDYGVVAAESDNEIGPRIKAAIAHNSDALHMRAQGTPTGGIRSKYNITGFEYDNLELNNLHMDDVDDCNAITVPITNGIERNKVIPLSVGVGAGVIPLAFGFEPDLIIFYGCFRTTAPATDDGNTPGQRQTGNCWWMYGAALNGGVSRCVHYHELDQLSSAVCSPSFQLKNNAAIVKHTSGVEDFSGTVGNWNSNGADLTVTAGANGEYLFAHGFKFTDPSVVTLLDTTIPTAGAWEVSGLPFKPQTVINFSLYNVSSWNSIEEEEFGFSITAFDSHDAFSVGVNSCSGISSTDGTASAFGYDDVVMRRKQNSPVGNDITEFSFEQPRITPDGWKAPAIVNPTLSVLGWAIVLGY